MFSPSLGFFELFLLLFHTLLHVAHLLLVYFLNLSGLVPDDADVLFVGFALVLELFLDLRGVFDVLLLGGLLFFFSSIVYSSNFLAHLPVLNPDSLVFLLESALLIRKSGEQVHVLLKDLGVEMFFFLALFHSSLNLFDLLDENASGIFLLGCFLGPQLHQDVLKGHTVLCYFPMQIVHFFSHAARVVVG
jgi:hypothetical protein